MEMNDLLEEMVRLYSEGRRAMPDSGQFAVTRETQKLVEFEAIQQALEWLRKNRGYSELESYVQPDPPDVRATLVDGQVLDFEFASVTHQETMKLIKDREKKLGTQGEYQDWTAPVFQDWVRKLVADKDRKYRPHLKKGLVAKPLILVLGSDSRTTHAGLADGLQVESDVFDEILLHLGYIPDPTGARDGESDYCITDIKRVENGCASI